MEVFSERSLEMKKFLLWTIALMMILSGCSPTSVSEEETAPLDYVMYEKEGLIYFQTMGSEDATQLNTEPFDDSNFGAATTFQYNFKISDNQKRIFYKEISGIGDFFGTLYYRDVLSDGKLSDAKKIADEVSEYNVSSNGQIVNYVAEQGGIYHFDIQKSKTQKLSDTAFSFTMSKDGKRLIYSENNGEKSVTFEQEIGKNRFQVGDKFMSPVKHDPDLTEYYYFAEGEVGHRIFGSEGKVIADDVYRIIQIYDSGEMYFMRVVRGASVVEEFDFLNDDMVEQDEKYESVARPDFPDVNADEVEWAEYRIALAEFNRSDAKNLRDDFRARMERGSGVFTDNLQLYYYDGEKEHFVAEYLSPISSDLRDLRQYAVSKAQPMIAFSSFDHTTNSVRLSEANQWHSMENMVQDILELASMPMIAKGAEAQKIESDLGNSTSKSFVFSADGKTLYYFFGEMEPVFHQDLYEISIGDSAGKPQLAQEWVYPHGLRSYENGDLLYVTERDLDATMLVNLSREILMQGIGSNIERNIVLNGKVIAENAFPYWTSNDRAEILYRQSEERGFVGKLFLYKDGENIFIDDEVAKAMTNQAETIFYMKNLDEDYMKGDLYVHKDGENKLIATNVQYVDPTFMYFY